MSIPLLPKKLDPLIFLKIIGVKRETNFLMRWVERSKYSKKKKKCSKIMRFLLNANVDIGIHSICMFRVAVRLTFYRITTK